MLDVPLRTITFILLMLRGGYWYISGITAKKEKPPTKSGSSLQAQSGWIVSWALEVVVLLQLINSFVILPFRYYLAWVQMVGVVICALGVLICFFARHELGANWTHAADYQIKEKHNLITSGIYQYIRHPIYLGLALSWIGAEMVAESYLCVSFLALFLVFYVQGKREEKILLVHFSASYKDYMKKTKMLIPFVL